MTKKLYFKKIKIPTIKNQSKYKEYRNKLNRIIKKAKADYYKLKFQTSGNKSKIVWPAINEILGKRKKNQ